MKPEIVDSIRGRLRTDLAERIAAARLEADLVAGVTADVDELLDALLLAYQRSEIEPRVLPHVGQFVFVTVWPLVVQRLAPAVAVMHSGDQTAGKRFQNAVEAARRVSHG